MTAFAAASVELMAASVPVSVTVAVPLPAIVAVPPTTFKMPFVTERVTVMLPEPASESATLRPVMALLTSSLVLCAPGTVFTGALFTFSTVTWRLALA